MQEFEHNKSLIKRNILTYLKTLGVSKYEFYKVSGLSRGTLDNSSGMTEENIFKFLSYAKDVNLEWLLFGTGKMLKSTENSEEDDQNIEFQIAAESRLKYITRRIPVYNVRNTRGMIALLENPDDALPSDHLLIPDVENCDGAVFMAGDSMYPMLKSGDLVIYKIMRDKENSLFWGEIYILVIRVEEEEMTLVNYIQKSEKGEAYIALRGYNPQHQVKDIRLEQVIAFAQVKASIKLS